MYAQSQMCREKLSCEVYLSTGCSVASARGGSVRSFFRLGRGLGVADCHNFQRSRRWASRTPSSQRTTFDRPSQHTEAHSGNAGLEEPRSAGFRGGSAQCQSALIEHPLKSENLDGALETFGRALYRSGRSLGTSKQTIITVYLLLSSATSSTDHRAPLHEARTKSLLPNQRWLSARVYG